MVFDDDFDPRTKKPKLRPLDNFSVIELRDYILQLQEEILRVEAELMKKEKHKNAAEALFGKK